ncbi:hypothetical protein ABT065_04210 [Streptomyces sp. NPDC002764]|uniref:hypothetical protein n=1 Tax=Streptomyces sp. NPDC002764 TaxID=3154428 RepID=UPI00331DDAB9
MPHPLHDLSADLLGEAGVEGATHAAGFHGPEVFDVDDARADGEGVVDGPAGGGSGQGGVEVRAPVRHSPDLLGQDGVLATQRMCVGFDDEPLIVVGFGLQVFGLATQSMLFGEHTTGPESGTRTQRSDRPVAAQLDHPCAEQRVQPPVHAQRHGVPGASGLRHDMGVGQIDPHPPPLDAQSGQVQHSAGRNGRRQLDRARDPHPVPV